MTPEQLLPSLEPPYYAVIFVSRRTQGDSEGYSEASKRISDLAAQQPGYLGVHSSSSVDPTTGNVSGITVSYWKTERDIKNWKAVSEHRAAQQKGKEKWYDRYSTQVCKVERHYEGGKGV
jgi:heme-degrading monooxygenase HmoA